ncbi:GNAT family N-acetyltransferase [Sandaracinobacter neustonicus]|uniref:GNAT family N-acetyltransferase n=1 Tax=Sandaracinobacter neustonicus TaxID=1715348 RepID=A0A501XUG1_9SPHN|nr:GNAT family N-acetyltransferase [Sandaracinobacter neustonicus]TPE63983.1 GNAT family N-acetyltransferase [Sandaracinobacter neustonicus]
MSVQPNLPEPDQLRWSEGGIVASPAVAALAASSFDPQYREAWTELQIANLLAGGNAWLDLCHAGQELVAFALNRQVLDEVELLLCAVSPAWRGRRIGLRMMEQVADSARKRGGKRLFLEVRQGNEAAMALYLSAGLRQEGRRPAYYRTVVGDSIDAITFASFLQ